MHDPSEDISYEDAVSMVRETGGIGSHADKVVAALEPFIRITPGEAGEPAHPFESRFGGNRALLLPDQDWPFWELPILLPLISEPSSDAESASQTTALAPLAQINLSDLPAQGNRYLPQRGLLSFFGDYDNCFDASDTDDGGHSDAFRALFTPEDQLTDMTWLSMPALPGHHAESRLLPIRKMRFSLAWKLPVSLTNDPPDEIGFETLYELARRLAGSHREVGMFHHPSGRYGTPQEWAQDETRTEESGRADADAFRTWVTLLSLDSGDDIGLDDAVWHLAFVARQTDVARLRFDQCLVSICF